MNAKTVVVVEDDKQIREGLEEFLQIEGIPVRTANNGAEGLKVIKELNGHCLVLLDLQMPVMTGQQMLMELEGDPDIDFKSIPVIIITAGQGGVVRQRTSGTLRKPLDLKELLKKISGLTFSSPENLANQ